MADGPKEYDLRPVLPVPAIPDVPPPPVASEYQEFPEIEARVSAQFPYRILVVDDAALVCKTLAEFLERKGYEVLTAADGLDALHALAKSLPDLVISDLNMPRMSGFELLAVIRGRFPHIATIAMSLDYYSTADPSGITADAFVEKEHLEKIFHEIARLLAASPIRSERKKSELAPLFVPRDKAGYLIVTCPDCLRPNKLDATSLDGGIHQTLCRSCGATVKFEINHEIEAFGRVPAHLRHKLS
jgi:CheY-like chemotaxis protein